MAMISPYAFYISATIAVVMVVLMILQKNPVSSALCLVVSFFGLAALYVLLEAHFVAVLQILVYAGAIMVLFIFVIMLLNLKDQELTTDRINLKRIFVFLTGLALFAFLTLQFLKIPSQGEEGTFKALPEGFGTAQGVGQLMFADYVVPFELIGLLLLIGIVGAILLGRREE